MEHVESSSGHEESNSRSLRRHGCFVLILLILVLTATGCTSPEPEESSGETLRVGVLPDRSPEALRARYVPLVEHISAQTGLEVEIAIPETYEQLQEWFHDDQIQLAWFGGLTFVRAEQRSGARALVMRDVDLRFTSDFLVARSRQEKSLQEFAGASFSFGPTLSTSGHLMPLYHLWSEGIDPETRYASVQHSSGHDQTALWVQEGQVDIGAVNSVVVESMFEDGRLSRELVRILQTTPPYRNYVWAVRPDVPASTRAALQDGFLSLQLGDPKHAAILRAQGARGYLPASRDDFNELRQAATLARLLDD